MGALRKKPIKAYNSFAQYFNFVSLNVIFIFALIVAIAFFVSIGFAEDWWIIILGFSGIYLCTVPLLIMARRGLLISYIDEEYITSKICGKTIKKMHWTEIKHIKCVTSFNYSGENHYPFLLISSEPIEYVKHPAMKYNYKQCILIKLGENDEEIVNVFNRKLALSIDLNEIISKMKQQEQIDIY